MAWATLATCVRRKSVSVSFGARTLAFELKLLMEELDFVRGQINEVESELARLLDQTSGMWVTTVPGMGLVLASAIAGEISDPNRFGDAHQLMAYAGMGSTKSESGETVASDGNMSKRGSASPRWAFMEAADCVRRFDPYFGDYYAKKKGEDKKHHYIALSGVARKLMGVCPALMKEGRAYDPTPPKHNLPGHLREVAEQPSPHPNYAHAPVRGARQHACPLSRIHFSRFLLKSRDYPLTLNSRSF